MDDGDRQHADPPRCAECGYDRTGLPQTDSEPAPCPECGSRKVATEWPGWGPVLRVGITIPLWCFAVGVALPTGVLRLSAQSEAVRMVMAGLAGLAACTTATFSVLMPIAAAAAYSSSAWSREDHPGQLRVLLACWMAIVAGCAAASLIAVLGAETLAWLRG